MVAYADTSFLFSLYAQDANTARAAAAAENGGVTFLLTDFQRYELRNALRLSVFRGHLPGLTCRRLLQQVADDLDQGAFLAVPLVWGQVFAEAESLSAGHTGVLGTRAFDILHVAAAVTLGAKAFYTFDARQAALAKKAGLKVRPR
ncbi:MAG: PIN domain-containing protein [Kiritimatiellae bacterium]|nr:PIN domain-containing protein [Kiritimatiellia bacterium]